MLLGALAAAAAAGGLPRRTAALAVVRSKPERRRRNLVSYRNPVKPTNGKRRGWEERVWDWHAAWERENLEEGEPITFVTGNPKKLQEMATIAVHSTRGGGVSGRS